MPRLNDWIGRDVEIVATGERGHVAAIPISTPTTLTATVQIAGRGCESDGCPHVALRHYTIRDGQEPPIRVVE